MRALLTNDDGIDSPGLHELARHVEAAGFEVVVVAPSFDASGTGASLGHISRDRPIGYKEVQIDGLAGKAFALDGPPALCTITSHLEAFGPRPACRDLRAQSWPQYWQISSAQRHRWRGLSRSKLRHARPGRESCGFRGVALSTPPADIPLNCLKILVQWTRTLRAQSECARPALSSKRKALRWGRPC